MRGSRVVIPAVLRLEMLDCVDTREFPNVVSVLDSPFGGQVSPVWWPRWSLRCSLSTSLTDQFSLCASHFALLTSSTSRFSLHTSHFARSASRFANRLNFPLRFSLCLFALLTPLIAHLAPRTLTLHR